MLADALGIRGPIGAPLHDWFGLRRVFTTEGAALATAVMSFPLIMRSARLGLENVDPGLEAAAGTLGAGPLDRFVTVTLPLMSAGILAGTVTAPRRRRAACLHRARAQRGERPHAPRLRPRCRDALAAAPRGPGAWVRLRVRARDMAVATERPRGVSIHNVLPCILAAVLPTGAPGEVFLRLDLAGAALLARVTADVVPRLGLRPGVPLVKAIAFDHTPAPAAPPRGDAA